jgi:hypothetical protein
MDVAIIDSRQASMATRSRQLSIVGAQAPASLIKAGWGGIYAGSPLHPGGQIAQRSASVQKAAVDLTLPVFQIDQIACFRKICEFLFFPRTSAESFCKALDWADHGELLLRKLSCS